MHSRRLQEKKVMQQDTARARATDASSPTPSGSAHSIPVAGSHGRAQHTNSPDVDRQDPDIEMRDLSLSHPPGPPTPIEPLPKFTNTGRPWRPHRLPARYVDHHPVAPAPLPPIAPGSTAIPRVILHVRDAFETVRNSFGVHREYAHRPSYDPESAIPDEHLSTYYAKYQPNTDKPSEIAPSVEHAFPWPFPNMSTYLLMDWMHTGSQQKSEKEVNRLASDVLSHPEFLVADVAGFSAQAQGKVLDQSDNQESTTAPFLADGWHESSVDISVPLGSQDKRGFHAPFTVHGLHHRSILSVLKAALADVTARRFHFSPFKRFWKPPDGPEQRIFDEAYTSDAWLEENEKLQRQPNEPGCKLEKVVLGLGLYSDSTHLASFGIAKLWPLYIYILNLSKYFRGPANGIKPRVMTHCRRELMHGVFDKILDEDFVHSYKHGFKMECLDGVWRRFYPRIFTYSSDYPEKTLLSLIRGNGKCPCPRCFVEKSEIHRLGQVKDRQTRTNLRSYMGDLVRKARNFIYEKGHIVTSTLVEKLLFPQSWVPTINIFAEKLSPFGFDPHEIMVVDLMHEFELGVWKSVFIHLIRILHAAAPAGRLVGELDRRLMPTFGNSTIRRFTTNVSEMKKLAAHNYEDLLQCAIPAFEGLLPEPHNKIILTLLFRLAEWHALAKLRMHTDATMQLLDSATTILGQEMRQFSRITCAAYFTKELPAEVAARDRQQARKNAKAGASTVAPLADIPVAATADVRDTPLALPPLAAALPPPDEADGTHAIVNTTSPLTKKKKRKASDKKTFNLWTYKFHALGNYLRAIRRFGTTDSYSSQTGEREHRRVKRLYSRTNKHHATRQIARRERRETRLLRAKRAAQADLAHRHHPRSVDSDDLSPTHPAFHHHMSDSRRFGQDAFSFSRVFPNDPASKDFVPRLKDHLLSRMLGRQYDGDEELFTDADRASVHIEENRINSVKVLRINYTTYDLQRDRDSLNPRNHCDVMVMSPETGPHAHPYWYARVLGVFHARVYHTGPASKNTSMQHMEFLWVRWLGNVRQHRYGFKTGRLPKVGFVADTEPAPFGFLDPSLVVRACHLIPAFHDKRTSELLTANPSAGRPIGDTDDWSAFYVNWFADRDMIMRYIGGGVGHMHQNRTVIGDAAMDTDDLEEVEDGDKPLAMEVDSDDDADSDDAGIYGSDGGDEDSDEDSEDGEDDDSGPEDGQAEAMEYE
ncbi:hypothetical protein HWV62_24352 [Athelia sp. TMB]|nr:hypothetical protein HWV62_24352 [Athelia sp. TMB]